MGRRVKSFGIVYNAETQVFKAERHPCNTMIFQHGDIDDCRCLFGYDGTEERAGAVFLALVEIVVKRFVKDAFVIPGRRFRAIATNTAAAFVERISRLNEVVAEPVPDDNVVFFYACGNQACDDCVNNFRFGGKFYTAEGVNFDAYNVVRGKERPPGVSRLLLPVRANIPSSTILRTISGSGFPFCITPLLLTATTRPFLRVKAYFLWMPPPGFPVRSILIQARQRQVRCISENFFVNGDGYRWYEWPFLLKIVFCSSPLKVGLYPTRPVAQSFSLMDSSITRCPGNYHKMPVPIPGTTAIKPKGLSYECKKGLAPFKPANKAFSFFPLHYVLLVFLIFFKDHIVVILFQLFAYVSVLLVPVFCTAF